MLYTKSQTGEDDKFLHGLQKALRESGIISEADLAAVEKVKATGKQLFAPEKGGSYDVWEVRLSKTPEKDSQSRGKERDKEKG